MGTGDERTIVIGAGSTGSSIAYHLTRAGRRVIVVEMGQVAQGMTSRSTANVRTHYSNEIMAKMALYSLRVLRDFSSVGRSGFVNSGMLFLAPSAYRPMMDANISMLRSLGIEEQVLDRPDAERRFPEVSLADVDYIAFEPDSGYADPVATAISYAEKARELGAELVTGKAVERIETEDGVAASVLLSDGSRIRGSEFVLCTNVWTNKLLARSGVGNGDLMPIRPVAHPVLVYKRPESLRGRKTIVADYYNKLYYKPEGEYLLYGGNLDPELDKTSIDPDECPVQVPDDYVMAYSELLLKRLPALQEGMVQSAYYGMYDITPDEYPIMEELSAIGLKGVYTCVGLSGMGFKICPALGVMMTEMILGTEASEQTFDISAFRLSRFGEGKLMTTRFQGLGTVG